VTDVGMTRSLNEDAFLDLPDAGLWMVADGMGGHAHGELASALAVEALQETPLPPGLAARVDRVEDALHRADEAIRDLAARKGKRQVGSTVALLLAHDRHVVCLWAGDSRIYRWRGGELEQLTRDHAYVEELLAMGLIDAEEARNHPQGNIVTRALGASERLHLDAEVYALEPGDCYLLCSDGLTRELEDADIAATLTATPPLEGCRELLERALARGGHDNTTVVLARFQP
jgi:serine/threonine protein phosphatase PrpC